MKISVNWINDYVDVENLDKRELADKITNAGVNIEGIHEYKFNNLVVGEIVDCKRHPASDHLNICMVNVGDEVLQIICGADNVKKGIKVIVALVGAVLPGDFEIAKRKLAGTESNGMICALYELGLEDKETHYDDGICVLPEDAKVGDDPLKYLGIDDTIYDLDLNPNRNDCLSHLGFAYEVASVLGQKVKMPDVSYKENNENISDYLKLDVETENVPLFEMKMVKNVKIGPSPDFIKKRLEAVGMRSINNVVDISNYIMLEYGQPLHFYDKDKVGDHFLVRMAKNDEKITTLDNEERVLNDTDIVITDGDKPIAIAGVMGGLDTEITDSTRDVVIESAIFNPYNNRYTSIRLGLRSEASLRNEKELNYEYTSLALDRACHLLEKYANATVVSGRLVHDKLDKSPKVATVTDSRISKLLGIDITKDDVCNILEKLGFSYEYKNNTYTVTIPNRRMDVAIREDIIEEIARIYGYDKIKSNIIVGDIKPGSYTGHIGLRKSISKRLRALLLNEVKTYTLVSEEETKLFKEYDNIKLLLPMSNDKAYVRSSIIPSLFKVYDYNRARGINDINIYEIAKVYHPDYEEEVKLAILMSNYYIPDDFNHKAIKTDFYTIKGVVENLFKYLGLSKRLTFIKNDFIEELHPGISAKIVLDKDVIGFIGKINPSIKNDDLYVCEISLSKLFDKRVSALKYPEVSKYPDVKKDVSFILSNEVLASDVMKDISRSGGKILKEIKVFDLYHGDKIPEGKKSLSFSLTFNDLDKTLTDVEVDKVFRTIIDKVCQKYKAELRDK